MLQIVFELLVIVASISAVGISFCAGAFWIMNRQEKKMSARVIRPANITIERNIHITEYNVVNDETLDIDFPETRKIER